MTSDSFEHVDFPNGVEIRSLRAAPDSRRIRCHGIDGKTNPFSGENAGKNRFVHIVKVAGGTGSVVRMFFAVFLMKKGEKEFQKCVFCAIIYKQRKFAFIYCSAPAAEMVRCAENLWF